MKFELSQEGKGFLLFSVVMLIFIFSITLSAMLLSEIEYSADCEISGVNIGINKDMNFTGFDLNNSTIKCDIEGKLPAVILFALRDNGD